MNVRVIPHKRDKTKWAVDYRCPATKKRKYESFTTKKQAVARKQELEGKAATGEYRPLHRRTWAEFVAEYTEKVLAHAALKTQCAYSEAIAHFERVCSPTAMAAITTRVIDEFAAKRVAERWSRGKSQRHGAKRPRSFPIRPSTVNKNLRHLRAVLRRAHRWGYLPIVPEFKLLKTPDREPRAIPPKVFDRILEAAQSLDQRIVTSEARQRVARRKHLVRGPSHNPPGSDWWIAFLNVAYMAGLRWSEILGLRWGDLCLTRNPTITIRAEISKTARDQAVPMSATLADQLRKWMSRCPNVADEVLVFPHSCHQRTISLTWERLQTWALLAEPFRFHDLRVSFCTNLVASGTEAATLMKLARHKSLSTTMKFYRGRTEEADRRALDRMEASISRREGELQLAAPSQSGEQSGERVLHI